MLECYMTRHVDFPSRSRGTDNPSCIDCIFTNSEELVNNVLDKSPLGNSNHTVIQVDINARTTNAQKSFKKFYYDKGHYNGMKRFVKDMMDQAPDFQDIDQQWDYFMDTLREAQEKYIPSKVIKSSSWWQKHQGSPLDNNIIREIKKKHRCWQRYMETRCGEKYTEYRRLSNQVKKTHKES